MKGSIILCLLFGAVLVASERCRSVRECQLVQCSDSAQLICERGECTCAAVQNKCRTLSDCTGSLRCGANSSPHCVDNTCQCLADDQL